MPSTRHSPALLFDISLALSAWRSVGDRDQRTARECQPRARGAGALGVGLLSGGYGEEELERAGAYRVYSDPADLLRHLDEIGARLPE
jgi:hypothetical protein